MSDELASYHRNNSVRRGAQKCARERNRSSRSKRTESCFDLTEEQLDALEQEHERKKDNG